jgi:hypothetical protein
MECFRTSDAARRDGDWAITVYLAPGRIVYLFSVDRVMWLDPQDNERLANGWGSEYSVRHIVAELTPVAMVASA